ncbi:hypothetical protein TNCV_4927021 [Trichonephila clavipes]|nr:hypothetical protein TNCV_4927021 [Trichonephila clavipes]
MGKKQVIHDGYDLNMTHNLVRASGKVIMTRVPIGYEHEPVNGETNEEYCDPHNEGAQTTPYTRGQQTSGDETQVGSEIR